MYKVIYNYEFFEPFEYEVLNAEFKGTSLEVYNGRVIRKIRLNTLKSDRPLLTSVVIRDGEGNAVDGRMVYADGTIERGGWR